MGGRLGSSLSVGLVPEFIGQRAFTIEFELCGPELGLSFVQVVQGGVAV